MPGRIIQGIHPHLGHGGGLAGRDHDPQFVVSRRHRPVQGGQGRGGGVLGKAAAKDRRRPGCQAGNGKKSVPSRKDGAPDAFAPEGVIGESGDRSPGLEGLLFYPCPGPGDVDAPVGSQGIAVIGRGKEEAGKGVRIHFHLGAVGEAAPLFPRTREEEGRFPPVGAKVGTKIDTGAAAAAQARLEDLVVEFIRTEFLHD